MKRHLIGALILSVVLLASCKGKEEKTTPSSELTGFTTHFPKFPEKQFESIYLLQPIEEAEAQISSEGFERLENKSGHFINKEEQIEVLISGIKKVKSIRIFFLAQDDISESKRLLKLLQIAAIDEKRSPEFSYFTYKTKSTLFSVTFFVQDDLLRLNIELIKPQ